MVEVKWEQKVLGREKVSSHLVRVFSRGFAGGIFISYSDYSAGAYQDCKEALREKVIVLCRLEEFVRTLEDDVDLSDFLQEKIVAAIINKSRLKSLPLEQSTFSVGTKQKPELTWIGMENRLRLEPRIHSQDAALFR